MSIPASKTFNICNRISSITGKEFGEKYGGSFVLRRPSLLDKKNIALRDAVSMSSAGEVDITLVGQGTRLISYIFSFVETVAEHPLPEWFNMATLYDEEDEEAVLAVWEETSLMLDTFRPQTDRKGSEQGGQQPSLLVPAEV